MTWFRFIAYDERGDIIFDASEQGANRAEALTTLMNYPHWAPGQRERLHTLDIFTRSGPP